MSKADRYAKGTSESKSSDLEDISNRLAVELRNKIRAMNTFEIFSKEWCDMAETCGRIASISDVELSLSASKSDGTLWETDEQALRFLTEDGKLNLCLRNLIDYKHKMNRQMIDKSDDPPTQQFQDIGDQFEKGMGTLLRNCWQHIEALQTTDIDALIRYIADVMEACEKLEEYFDNLAANRDLHQRQEVMVFEYMSLLVENIDEFEESRIMPILRNERVFIVGVKFLNKYAQALPLSTLLKCLQSLAHLVESEEFGTYRDSHIDMGNGEHMELLLVFKEKCLIPYSGDFENRKIVRPLIDTVDKAERTFNARKSRK